MRQPTVMAHDFGRIPGPDVQRSTFDLSHAYKTTFDSGFLIPVFVQEVLPGDVHNIKMTSFVRMQTAIHPFMDNIYVEDFSFFVPHRLVWDNWEKMQGFQENPADSTTFLMPVMAAAGTYATQSLGDYLGIPTLETNQVPVSLPFRCCNLIWNEWFRDQNLQNSVVVDKGDGPDAIADYVLMRRNKRYDYFTSCLKQPQKGTPVLLPLGTSAPVVLDSTLTDSNVLKVAATRGTFASADGLSYENAAGGNRLTNDALTRAVIDPNGQWFADLSSATASSINELREAFAFQKILERDARGGTRYTEIIRAHWGVTSRDARLQRSEFLGSGSAMVHVNPVSQTGESGATAQANLAAYGTASGTSGFTQRFTEHGTLLTFVNVRADLTYQQGMDRMFRKRTRFELYMPALAHIGEQAVQVGEIFSDGSGNDILTFGFQEAWAEYRYKQSHITGKFRSNAVGSLDFWHLSQDFATFPILTDAFIQDNPPIARVVAVTSEPQFYADFYFDYKCTRLMPMHSVPGMIDRF